MKTIMLMIAAASVAGIFSFAQAGEAESGNKARQSAHDVAVKKCERLKGDARSACLKDAEAKRGAPARTDIKKPDRVRPESVKPDVKK